MNRPEFRYPITQPVLGKDELAAIRECLESGWVTQGPRVARFQELFRKRHNAEYALATTSCTAALHMSMLTLGIGPGDEVIVPAFTWITSAHCAEYAGARAVFADVKPDTFNIDPDAFEAAVTPRTKAVVVVHLFGLAAEMDKLLQIARKHDLIVIEDAACAAGTTYDGKPVGTFGGTGCFSFHPRKVITTGEGGMVLTDDKNLYSRLISFGNHGTIAHTIDSPDAGQPDFMGEFGELGFNLRLSDILAAVGIVQMGRLDSLLKERRYFADRYSEMLADVDEIALPVGNEKCGHTYQSYVIRILEGGKKRRNAVMRSLADDGIQTRPGTHAVHRLKYYRDKYGLKSEDFPVASLSEDTSITLPIFPGITEAQQDEIMKSLRKNLP